jgi:hypothetical protein
MHHRTAAASNEALGTILFSVARFAVHLAVVFCQRGRIQSLVARLASKARFVPVTTRTEGLFSVVNRFCASRALRGLSKCRCHDWDETKDWNDVKEENQEILPSHPGLLFGADRKRFLLFGSFKSSVLDSDRTLKSEIWTRRVQFAVG